MPFYFIKILSKDFSSPFPEVTLKRLDTIFANSRKLANMTTSKQGVLLFFDEIDTLVSTAMDRTVRGTLLHYIEDKNGLRNNDSKVMLMAATNLPLTYLDSAIIRMGRFDTKIEIKHPTEEEGIEILRIFFEEDTTTFATNLDATLRNIYSSINKQKESLGDGISVADLQHAYVRKKNIAYQNHDETSIYVKQ